MRYNITLTDVTLNDSAPSCLIQFLRIYVSEKMVEA